MVGLLGRGWTLVFYVMSVMRWCVVCFFFQAEDGIRDAQESRGLGDVYKRQLRCGSFSHIQSHKDI